MPLYDPFRKKDLISPKETEKFEYVQAFIRNAGRKFPKCERIIQEGIQHMVDEGGDVNYLRVATLFGEESPLPHADVRHLWEVIHEIFRGERDSDLRAKFEKMTLGCLLRWQISLRPEQWLTYKKDGTKFDPISGDLITFAVYKIDPNYTPHHAPKKRASISDLANKWGVSTS